MSKLAPKASPPGGAEELSEAPAAAQAPADAGPSEGAEVPPVAQKPRPDGRAPARRLKPLSLVDSDGEYDDDERLGWAQQILARLLDLLKR